MYSDKRCDRPPKRRHASRAGVYPVMGRLSVLNMVTLCAYGFAPKLAWRISIVAKPTSMISHSLGAVPRPTYGSMCEYSDTLQHAAYVRGRLSQTRLRADALAVIAHIVPK
jgi:polysaccharide pyruvyl transferase WcaK-like protein